MKGAAAAAIPRHQQNKVETVSGFTTRSELRLE